MAQAVRDRSQAAAAVEVEVEEKCEDRAAVSAAVNGGTKAHGNGVVAVEARAEACSERKNRIQVSNTKKPLFFYLNLAKRYLKQYNDVELSALGMAIPTVVTISEILKANGVAVEKKVLTSTVGTKDETKGRLVQKAKIEIVLERNHGVKNYEDAQSDEEVKQKEE